MTGCIAHPLRQAPNRWRVSWRHRHPRLSIRCFANSISPGFDFLNPSSKPSSDTSKSSSGPSSSSINTAGTQSPSASRAKSSLEMLKETSAASSSSPRKHAPKSSFPRAQPLATGNKNSSLGGVGRMIAAKSSNPTRRLTPQNPPTKPLESLFADMVDSTRSTATPNPMDTFFGTTDDRLLDPRAGIARRDRPAPIPQDRQRVMDELHHLHIYATKHNTHLTLTRPDGDSIISVATGVLGLRKANRGTYDAAYQLAAYVMKRIQERGLLREIYKLELVFRDFGAGRNAVTNALMGVDGKLLRGRIVRLTDATRLKQGGTRSPKPRRLG